LPQVISFAFQETPALRFCGWHSGHGVHPSRFADGAPSWVCVKNTGIANPREATKTAVRIEWRNDADTDVYIIPEADWYQITTFTRGRSTGRGTGFCQSVDVAGGADRSFVLFVSREGGELPAVYKTGQRLEGLLNPGHWRATLHVSSDSVSGFEGTIGFTVLQQGGIHPDSPAFNMLRSVPPRLRSVLQSPGSTTRVD
jgi:hypothetical protein